VPAADIELRHSFWKFAARQTSTPAKQFVIHHLVKSHQFFLADNQHGDSTFSNPPPPRLAFCRWRLCLTAIIEMSCYGPVRPNASVGVYGGWCRLQKSNPRPSDYKSAALPTELSRLGADYTLANMRVAEGRLKLESFDRLRTNGLKATADPLRHAQGRLWCTQDDRPG
jgi:hypothetical protein